MRNHFLHSVLLLIASAIFTPNSARAQTIAPPAIEWQQSFGGTNQELGFHVLQTPDGGYIIAGVSTSGADGNKTSPSFGEYDYWVLRLDPNGNKLWERSYGGSSSDMLTAIQPASDGGWMLAGSTASPAGSGNRTSPLIGTGDYWLIHIDADGSILWQKNYGCANNWTGNYRSLQRTGDGGYLIGGSMALSDTGLDAWLIRLDAEGNQLWKQTFGGNSIDEYPRTQQTPDGGFMLGVISWSRYGGNKTSTNFGGADFWLLRLDANGTKIWDKSFGGTAMEYFHNLICTPDGGFLLGGISASVASGNKTSAYYGASMGDFWVVRVNAEGEWLWDNSYGGHGDEFLEDLQPTADGGFLLTGSSQSGAGGNKSTTNFGIENGWVVRVDSKGNKLWEQVFGGTNFGRIESNQQTRDGGYILVGVSAGGVGGNKTTPGFGGSDLWVIKLAPDALSAPPRLRLQAQSQAEIQTNGSRFFLSGVSNQLYRIEYSTDFRDWIPLQTNRASARELEVVDPAATNSVRRYYRAQPIPE